MSQQGWELLPPRSKHIKKDSENWIFTHSWINTAPHLQFKFQQIFKKVSRKLDATCKKTTREESKAWVISANAHKSFHFEVTLF